jgi:polysaccharide deacetylase 2 family uncharacterized protein YibQ
MSRRFLPAAVCAGLLLAASSHAADGPRIAIIIDDLGHQQGTGERVIALPGPVACAILPGTPRAGALARQARVYRKEVLVHLPMEAANFHGDTEAGTLSLDMGREDLVAALDAALAEIPHAIGVNNHRGSLLTRHPGHMQWLMQELHARAPLFFVDSYTTHHSIALQIAAENGVRAVKRDVFLDADPAPERIRAELERLIGLARERGSAVAIGHPYEATLAILEEELPLLAEAGVELVPISELVTNPVRLSYSNDDREVTF